MLGKVLTLGFVCVPASSFEYKTALLTLVFGLPWVLGRKTIRNRCAMRLRGGSGFGDGDPRVRLLRRVLLRGINAHAAGMGVL
jgi:hypothetical protein